MKRIKKISFQKNIRDSTIARISFPTIWLKEMNVTPELPEVVVEFNNNIITISKKENEDEETRTE